VIRILLDCRMADWSGVGRYTTGLARALAARDDVELVQVVAAGGTAPAPGSEAVAAAAHPFTPAGGLELGRIAAAARADITHCLHFPTPIPAPHPLVITIHDLTPIVIPGTMRPFPHGLGYRLWNRRASRVADRIITPSDFTAADVERLFPKAAGKLRVTPEAADDFTAGPIAELPARLAGPGPYLLSIGNTKPHKDLPTLLRAFASLASGRPDLRLLLVGADTPGYAAQHLPAAPPSVVERVVFTGRVTDAELRGLYANAAAFAFPSTYEGFGLPPLEAMSLGAPVVSTTAASLAEVVDDAALTVPPGDAEVLAATLGRILDNPGLADGLRARGRAHAARFTWAATAEATVAVYAELT
jgi:glycosyltransferase involved in cell wall biosynthesis